MRIGDAVTYVDAAGHVYPARVTAVVGAGPSGFKRLDLAYGTTELAPGVLHVGDAPRGPYWCAVGETPPVLDLPTWPEDVPEEGEEY